jgi:hypothetical protein
MKKSNPSVYPITAGFEDQLKLMHIMNEVNGELFWDLPLEPKNIHQANFNQVQDVAKTMHETLGEYEHGTAEPEELLAGGIRVRLQDPDDPEYAENLRRRVALITLRNVYIDLLLTMGAK